MFTGLIETTGLVHSLEKQGSQARLTVKAEFADADPIVLGESIAINGCCLTVVEMGGGLFSFDVLMQTLKVTALDKLRLGSIVNLERALQANARLGGHFVLGHVDATGTIAAIEQHGQDHKLDIQLPPEIARLCIDKGSLAIDGISLTIAELIDTTARFWIIPHTYKVTNLQQARLGDKVNLEADVLAKHVARLLESSQFIRGQER